MRNDFDGALALMLTTLPITAVAEEPMSEASPVVTASPEEKLDHSAPPFGQRVEEPVDSSHVDSSPSVGIDANSTESITISPMAVGPNGALVPFVYWTVKDSAGNAVGGASFTIQGPRSSDSGSDATDLLWASNSRTVTDCVTAPNLCPEDSRDRDPDPGEFLVKYLSSNSDAIPVKVDRRYRVRQTDPPSGHSWVASSDWRVIAGSGQEPGRNTWSEQTYDFGTFQVTQAQRATITVNKRVLRNSTDYLAGARFRLHRYANATTVGEPINENWATCTVATGASSCQITVPGSFTGQQYFVVEEAAAAVTYGIPRVAVGSGGDVTSSVPYPGATGSIGPGSSISLPSGNISFPAGTNSQRTTVGQTVNALRSPVKEPKCEAGLNIILALDMSGSIASNQRGPYGNGLRSLVSSLSATGMPPSNMTVIPFNTQAQASPVASPAPVNSALGDTLYNYVNNGSNYANATNWDSAFQRASEQSGLGGYDLMIFVTDGAPNQNRGGDSNPAVRSLENAVLSANAVKAAGVPVVAVGVGNALIGTNGPLAEMNLKAVSGVTKNADYFLGDWVQLGGQLGDVVKRATCTVPIEVSKTTIDKTSTPNVTTPYALGWTFGATKIAGGSGTLTAPTPANGTTTSGPAGTVKWDLRFTTTAQTGGVTIAETPQDGWTLTDVACTLNGVDHDVDIVDGNKITVTGLHAGSGKLECAYTNTRDASGRLGITKAFDGVPEGFGNIPFTGGYTCTKDDQTVSAGTWSRTGSGTATLTRTSGADPTQLPAGAMCSATENQPSGSDGLPNGSWTWASAALSAPVTIVNGQTGIITVTNKANPPGSVIWTKVAAESGSTLAGSEWLLTGPNVPGNTSVTDCTAAPCILGAYADRDPAAGRFQLTDLAWGTYQLVETKAPPGYILDPEPRSFTISADALAITLIIENTTVTPPILPLTGGLGRDFYTLLGLGIVALTLGTYGYMRVRHRRSHLG